METENHLNYLTARFPAPIERSSGTFMDIVVDSIQAGVPSQLLVNRSDILQAELELVSRQIGRKSC